MAQEMRKKADLLFRDLIEPIDLYYKHYIQTNNSILQDCQRVWTSLHQERTQMLFAKEEYYNQMHTLKECKNRI